MNKFLALAATQLATTKRSFWLSWRAYTMRFEMHTPWWVSGVAGDGSYSNVCAIVPADTEEDAWAYVRACHDDKGADLSGVRFCDLSTRSKEDTTPIEGTEWPLGGDRFQRSDWMVWRDNMPKFKYLRMKQRARIYQAMKEAGHWYYVRISYWNDKLPGVCAIQLDGFPMVKFQVLGNGWLRIVWFRDNPYLRWAEMGITLGRCMPVDQLIEFIKKHPHKSDIPTGQSLSLAECVKIIKEQDKPIPLIGEFHGKMRNAQTGGEWVDVHLKPKS